MIKKILIIMLMLIVIFFILTVVTYNYESLDLLRNDIVGNESEILEGNLYTEELQKNYPR